uniref:Uncharacterized protein n=1 Tax=Astyanax mexicanus TaxID=7994 RepID=A0A8B9KQM1_ASTMX
MFETSISLILMMRSAMLFTSTSVLRIVAIGRMRIFNCDSTRLASSVSLQTIVKPPTRSPHLPYRPMFLAKDWERTMLWPCSMKWRTAQASRSISPLAKP